MINSDIRQYCKCLGLMRRANDHWRWMVNNKDYLMEKKHYAASKGKVINMMLYKIQLRQSHSFCVICLSIYKDI